MPLAEILQIVLAVVLIYVAFRIGAVLMKVLLGLIAIAVIVWLVSGWMNGAGVPEAAVGTLAAQLTQT